MEESFSPEGMLDSYLYECFQLLEQMDAIVLSGDGEGFFHADDIQEIFRILHTIKGTSGIMMYDNIGLMAHKLEDIFYYLREVSAQEVPKAGLTECIFAAADFMMEELGKIKRGEHPDGNPEEAVRKTEEYLEAVKAEIRRRGVEMPPENVYASPGMYYNAPLQEKPKPRKRVKIDLGTEPEPKPEMHPGDYVLMERKQAGKEALIGISIEKLEKVNALSKKLLQLNVEADTLEKESIKRRLHEIVEELRASVWDMRKTPIATIFRRMNRVVYSLSHRLSKEIEIRTEGEELLADRLLVEQLTEPMLHVVRNAADHGIESVEERRAAGKKPRGVITLGAWTEGKRLFLSVKNDGRKLDAGRIFARAKEKGFIAMDADIGNYGEEEIFRMITRPGFSTMDTVTEISGRGIGMDIVASRLKELGGSLRIRNLPDEGVEMVMEVPLESMEPAESVDSME